MIGKPETCPRCGRPLAYDDLVERTLRWREPRWHCQPCDAAAQRRARSDHALTTIPIGHGGPPVESNR